MTIPIVEENIYSFRAFVLSKGFLSHHFKGVSRETGLESFTKNSEVSIIFKLITVGHRKEILY